MTNVIPNGQMKKRKRKTIPIASNGSPQMDLKHYRLSQNGKINTIGYNSCKETTTKGEKQTKEHENVKMLFCLVTNVIS